MTLQDLFLALRLRWYVLAGAALLGVLAAGAILLVTPNTYIATATVALRWVGPQPGVAEVNNARYLTREAQTVALLVERRDVLASTSEFVGGGETAESLAGRVTAAVPIDTQLVRIRGAAGGPKAATDLANAAARAVVEHSAGESLSPSVDTTVVVPARVPAGPALPLRGAYLATGLLAGLMVGVAGALLSARRASAPEETLPVPAGAEDGGLSHAEVRLVSYLAWVILIAASIPWRTGTFYEGGADPVVIAKAGLSLIGLALGVWAVSRSPVLLPVPAVPVLMLGLYLGVTVVGGIANQTASAAIVVAVRVSILGATLCLMAAVIPAADLMRRLVHVLGVLVFVGAGTGMVLNDAARLGGAIPMLNPNLLALIAAIIVMWVMSKVFTAREGALEFFVAAACVVIILQTGSRTALAALGGSVGAMLLRCTALRTRTLTLAALSIPVITLVALGTDILNSVFTRGGTQSVSGFSNRSIAWEAAANLQRDGWGTWFGQGLAQKEISVPGQWWNTQILDSSWVSALVQGGYLGVAIVALLTVMVLIKALFAPRSLGPLWLGLTLYLAVGGFLESGLFDGTVQFMVFLVASLAVCGARRSGGHQRPSVLEPAGRPMAEATSAGSASAMLA
ncbi:hypothetical protein BW730_00750 [Tessaracoccus aquimaris]|uniref:Polysaccharide chain length determinant N-terminal domain-containing protein n=1 Tax=Tessaracoccus aquimaris TaxID=1332264 RepID=A0A1Q2CJK6_9ACTN|nr:hypothetical protein [Tessaracoccus aquimaris]AQP46316.1 hypothetical protein BW730_00750 [Tessaracoccus aquimaris]